MVLDRNNDGHASSDETAAWVRKTLMTYYGEFKGEKLFDKFYPSYIFAFRDAADADETHVVETKTGSKSSDDLIQKSEFRLLCSYMTIYATMYDAFDTLDYGADLEEEEEIVPTMSERLEESGAVSRDCIHFVRAFESLGERSDEGRATRTQSWMVLDRFTTTTALLPISNFQLHKITNTHLRYVVHDIIDVLSKLKKC